AARDRRAPRHHARARAPDPERGAREPLPRAAARPRGRALAGRARFGRVTPRALYVHVPFCIRRCAYCDFATAPYDAGSADRYLTRLARELERVPRDATLDTIYFGGGTPTALSEAQLEALLAAVRARTNGAREEWTCEANPESVTPAKARMLRAAGGGRLGPRAPSVRPPA